jgi:hypothetical protein
MAAQDIQPAIWVNPNISTKVTPFPMLPHYIIYITIMAFEYAYFSIVPIANLVWAVQRRPSQLL